MRRPSVFLCFVALGLILDQVSKVLAFRALGDGPSIPLISGILHLTHGRNTGVAFSLFNRHPNLILLFTSLAVAGLVWWWWRTRAKASQWTLLALALILTGAVGNLIDRFLLGYVRDFIDFRPELPVIGHWAVFNVADSCICVGVVLYLVGEWLSKPDGADPKSMPTPTGKPPET